MKVRTLASLSGPAGNFGKDEVIDVSVTLGAELIERKLAEPVSTSRSKPPKPNEAE
ncbi:hypothetical protein [Pseudomonas kurunegalensis]|uniref:hypothetical protein n=1 Tax=Pseudomonas kurunegalensis TaxID=485880 RepID=UPI002895487F|nr:hypothetical protein [Pseudomonas kurunegalensis]MDT3749746.1 hypothetical protein [Pseudomonas kurunegalensis]